MAGFGGLINTEDMQTTLTNNVRRDIAVSGQGVYSAPQTRNAGNIRIGQRGTLTINNGASSQDLADLAAGIHASIGSRESAGSTQDGIDAAIAARIQDNVASGSPSVVNALGAQNWILIAAGFVALLAVAFFLRKKK